MVYLIYNLFIVLGFAATITISLPTRQLPTVFRPRITITQASSATEHEANARTGECIEINDTNNPTEIRLNSNHPVSSYQLLGYSSSTDCPNKEAILDETISLNQPKELNVRKKICSFQMQEPVTQAEPFTIKFTYGTNPSVGPRQFTFTRNECQNLCDANGSSSAYAYPHNVEILGGSNLLKLYTKADCEASSLLPLANVRNGRSLVEDTREDDNIIVKYIMIKEVMPVRETN